MQINATTMAAVYQNLKTVFFGVLKQATYPWEKIATKVSSSTAKNIYAILGDLPGIREWIGDRRIKDLKGSTYEVPNRKWEQTLGVREEDIEDDQLGMYQPMISQMADNWVRHPMKLLGELLAAGDTTLCYDGQNFFDTDHEVAGASVSNWGAGSGDRWGLMDTKRPLKPLIFQERRKVRFIAKDDPQKDDPAFMQGQFVYGADARYAVAYGFWQLAYGSRQTLNETNIDLAHDAMMAFTNDEGEALDVEPNLLVVGPSLRSTAEALIDKQVLTGGESNRLYKKYEILVLPQLG